MVETNGDVAHRRPPVVTLLTGTHAPPLAAAHRARGVEVSAADHFAVCWSMAAPDLLIVDAQSLSSTETGRLRALVDELDRRQIPSLLVTSGLDHLDPKYVARQAREGQDDPRNGLRENL